MAYYYLARFLLGNVIYISKKLSILIDVKKIIEKHVWQRWKLQQVQFSIKSQNNIIVKHCQDFWGPHSYGVGASLISKWTMYLSFLDECSLFIFDFIVSFNIFSFCSDISWKFSIPMFYYIIFDDVTIQH